MTDRPPSLAGRLAGRWRNRAALRSLVMLVPLLAGSCAGLEQNDQGLLQPQTLRGPCGLKKFYILPESAVHTNMVIGNTGDACTFTVFHLAQQIVLTAVYITSQPAHGHATAELTLLGRQASASYTPAPGYTGPDHFTVTIEPRDLAISVAVTVQPTSPVP